MVSNSEKLSKWAILSLQEPTFLDSVKLAYVCDSGNQAFLVTKDDDVFTIGTNTYPLHICMYVYFIIYTWLHMYTCMLLSILGILCILGIGDSFILGILGILL